MSLPPNLVTGRSARFVEHANSPRRNARGRRHEPGKMNKAETRYAELLKSRRLNGEVAWFGFESIKLRLADRTFYTPDFAVMLDNGDMEFHEVKGWMEDDAAVKLKVARETFWMFRFILINSKTLTAQD